MITPITPPVNTGGPNQPYLNDHHIADLARSGISPDVARACGLSSATADQINDPFGRNDITCGGLVNPFIDPWSGRPMVDSRGRPFVRVRLDEPHDGAKYLSRRRSGQHAYFPPIIHEHVRAGAGSWLLTEGEKKAVSACVHGLPCIGLTGNWGWRVAGQQQLLPELEQLAQPGTRFDLIWDSDAALNPGFAASTRLFNDALRARGCRLRVMILPPLGTGKTGLDDLLVAEGADWLREAIDA